MGLFLHIFVTNLAIIALSWRADASSGGAPTGAIRSCTPQELETPWRGAVNKIGTTYLYRGSSTLSVSIGTRVLSVRTNYMRSSQPTLLSNPPSGADFKDPDSVTYELFGFLPIMKGRKGSGFYRRAELGPEAQRIWTMPSRGVIQGNVREYTEYVGSSKSISGRYKVSLLGCSDIRIGKTTEAAKVFRVVMPYRWRNARTVPVQEGIRLNDFTYYVSLPRGVLLRQTTPSGSINIDRVVSVGNR